MRYYINIPSSRVFRLYSVAVILFVGLSMLTRMGLLMAARFEVDWGANLVGVFGWGLIFDIAAGAFVGLPWIPIGLLLNARLSSAFWGKLAIWCLLTSYASLLVFIGVSEWFFWNEFGTRFNFIAVDYLVWTQEVIGNILESYPMGWIGGGILLAGTCVAWGVQKLGCVNWAMRSKSGISGHLAGVLIAVLPSVCFWFGLSQSLLPDSLNQYHHELSKNGLWSFFAAFRQMEIDYSKWYQNLPEREALGRVKFLLRTDESVISSVSDDLSRTINKNGPEHRWNVILICLESHSADYLEYVGGENSLSPNLDRLAGESVFFENLYATGTRTVRGMEALTLNLPPTPGQAIIYRPEGTYLQTTFKPFLNRGYDCAFFYGGDGRFDFMNRYFSTSGCRVMDSGAWEVADTTFKTSWGACDEDLYQKVISEADKNHRNGKPFHYFCMTTSNHRPYDFPEGRVRLPNHSRKGAVQYADWAIGDMVRKAKDKPWFKNTLFVICADHCSGSAGKMELDVSKFHIPALIYNPELVPARKVSELCSQVDVMPTVFGLLNWSHVTLGFGHDRLSSSPTPERAFVSNYQKIALLRRDGLAILKPKREVAVYDVDFGKSLFKLTLSDDKRIIVRDAISYYQSASWLFGSGRLKVSGSAAPLCKPE